MTPKPTKPNPWTFDGAMIDEAVQRAMREAALMHARLGNPVATWRDGKVVWLPPEEVLADPRINPPAR